MLHAHVILLFDTARQPYQQLDNFIALSFGRSSANRESVCSTNSYLSCRFNELLHYDVSGMQASFCTVIANIMASFIITTFTTISHELFCLFVNEPEFKRLLSLVCTCSCWVSISDRLFVRVVCTEIHCDTVTAFIRSFRTETKIVSNSKICLNSVIKEKNV